MNSMEFIPSRCALAMVMVFIALSPSPCFGWAPATHLIYAHEVLQYARFLPVAVRELVLAFTPDFLYGCIAADITLGKKFVEYIHNCHNFDVGVKLLDHAHTDAERAFVYGYLSHLAADTVSHNFFVPFQNIFHFETRTFRHAYWEVRLDQHFGTGIWHEVQGIIKNPRTHTHDQLLDTALKDTLFSFKTNKFLFSGMLAIQRLKKWQLFVKSVNRSSQARFNKDELNEYNLLAVSAIIRFLSDLKHSPVYGVDPTGEQAIEAAKEIRMLFKKLRRNGKLTREIHHSECQRFRDEVKGKYFKDYPIDKEGFSPRINMKL